MAFAPFGVAAAAHAPIAQSAAHTAHTVHHDHAAMHAADNTGSEHCRDKSAACCCDDDAAACAKTCLQKCFGQMAVMPPDRAARTALLSRVAPRPAERPPGWSSAPQLPPPRA
jgi:hypothetical protein